MSPARYLAKHDYDGLRSAFRRLVRLVGGSRAAEQVSRVSHQAMERYGSTNPEHAERFAPLDVIADLEAECGEPVVTRLLAEMSGYVLVALPDGKTGSIPLTRITAEAMHKVSKVFSDLGAALENDGYINFEEDQQLHRDIVEAHAVLHALDEQITADRIAAERERGIER